ncbi:hypothetical protein [Actinomycetospora succinea]|uniref:hypothetical protein n=1 Tax=Actinomycetospora succinea TaxID=663603 RepID=UPI00105D8B54|nr:hypothetical protein [Actinomycetospora succinea]
MFEDGPSGDPALLRVFEQTDSGTSRWFQIEVDRPLRQFRGVELVYDNPGIAVAGPAKVSRLRVEVVAASDERFLLMDIVDLELPRNEERFIGNNFRVPLTTSIRRSFDSAVVRILTHLNHNRHFYRLALDLQQDAVSRYIDVHARVPGWVERPSDMNPVGVAGAHLAFFTADDGITPAADYDRAFISTPSGSTFVELMQGQVGLPVDNQAASSLPAKDGSLGWPEPYLPAAPAALASSIGSLNGASHETGGQPTAVSSKLSEKVDSLALASKIAEVLAQALASAGDAAGKKEEESAGAVENEESGEGPDGADAEEGAEGRKENE